MSGTTARTGCPIRHVSPIHSRVVERIVDKHGLLRLGSQHGVRFVLVVIGTPTRSCWKPVHVTDDHRSSLRREIAAVSDLSALAATVSVPCTISLTSGARQVRSSIQLSA